MALAAVEQYANVPAGGSWSILSGAINNSVTSLVVASASPYPTVGNFRIKIDDEIMLVTAVAGATFTVTRGAEGTTAASHADAVAVKHKLTRDGLLALGARLQPRGVYTDRPAAGLAGRIYNPTDSPIRAYDDGSAWQPFGPIWPLTDPTAQTFAWVNQGSATATAANGIIYLTSPAAGASENMRIRKKAIPQAAPWSVVVYLLPNHISDAAIHYGLVFRQSSDGKLQAVSLIGEGTSGGGTYGGMLLQSGNYSSATTNAGTEFLGSLHHVPYWLRIYDDGTNRGCKFSFDGVNFKGFYKEARGNYLTADEVGFYVSSYHVAPNTTGQDGECFDASCSVLSWKEGT